MRIFISWSGELSRKLAEAARKWLPGVIQAAQPYFSQGDIAKGARWNSDIAKVLEQSRVGLLCLTRENLEAPWIMFEAGALSKSLDTSRVLPILFGVEPADLTGPLVQFQAARFTKEDIRQVIDTINAELGDSALPAEVLDGVFEMWWPKLKSEVDQIMKASRPSKQPKARSERDMVEEVLLLLRSQARTPMDGSALNPRTVPELVASYEELVARARQLHVVGDLVGSIYRFQGPLYQLIQRLPPEKADELMKRMHAARSEIQAAVKPPATGADEMPF